MSYLWVAVGQAQGRGRLRELADDSDKNWIATEKGRKRKRPDGTWQYDYTKPGTGKKAAAKPVGAKPAASSKPVPQKAGSKTMKKVETPKKTVRKAGKKGAAFATPEVVDASLDFVKQFQQEKRRDVPFVELYRNLKENHPSASVEDFRHLVVALVRTGKIRLGSFSSSLDRMRDHELAFFRPDIGISGVGKYFMDMHLVDGIYNQPDPNAGEEYPEGPPELSPFQKQELQKKAAVAKKPTPKAGSKTMKKEGTAKPAAAKKQPSGGKKNPKSREAEAAILELLYGAGLEEDGFGVLGENEIAGLRKKLASVLPGKSFDEAILHLAAQDKVTINKHNTPHMILNRKGIIGDPDATGENGNHNYGTISLGRPEALADAAKPTRMKKESAAPAPKKAVGKPAKKEQQAGSDLAGLAKEVEQAYNTAASAETTNEKINALAPRLEKLGKGDLVAIAEKIEMVGAARFPAQKIREMIVERIHARKGATQRVAINRRPIGGTGSGEIDRDPAKKVETGEVEKQVADLYDRVHDGGRISRLELDSALAAVEKLPFGAVRVVAEKVGVGGKLPFGAGKKYLLARIEEKILERYRHDMSQWLRPDAAAPAPKKAVGKPAKK